MDDAKIKLAWERSVNTPLGHDKCRVFIGPDRDHLSLAGVLVFRPDEAWAFRATVRQGVTGCADAASGIFESGWSE